MDEKCLFKSQFLPASQTFEVWVYSKTEGHLTSQSLNFSDEEPRMEQTVELIRAYHDKMRTVTTSFPLP